MNINIFLQLLLNCLYKLINHYGFIKVVKPTHHLTKKGNLYTYVGHWYCYGDFGQDILICVSILDFFKIGILWLQSVKNAFMHGTNTFWGFYMFLPWVILLYSYKSYILRLFSLWLILKKPVKFLNQNMFYVTAILVS